MDRRRKNRKSTEGLSIEKRGKSTNILLGSKRLATMSGSENGKAYVYWCPEGLEDAVMEPISPEQEFMRLVEIFKLLKKWRDEYNSTPQSSKPDREQESPVQNTTGSTLNSYMSAANETAIRIEQPEGKKYVLMSEQIYDGFRSEIEALERRLLGMNEIIDGKTKPMIRGEDRTKRFRKA